MKEQSNNNLEHYIIKTLAYYDIFNYPLKAEEVFNFLQTNSVSLNDVCHSLNSLADRQQLYRHGDFYTLQANQELITRRITGNQRAVSYLEIAKRKAKFIALFPFVRAVLASGSLSKGYIDEKSDIDFFVITHPGRLWIARMLLVLYKRLFLFNSHKFFCVNYFVDTLHLEIEEKNIFTATELATVIPLHGAAYYKQLIASNGWLKGFFPNFSLRSVKEVPEEKAGITKKILEKIINLFAGRLANQFFMSLTRRRWDRLYKKNYGTNDFKVAFKTRDHVSKNHPNHYQRRVIELYNQKLNDFSKKHSINLVYE